MAAPNWLDRAIGWVSPEAGARRLSARQMMDFQRLAYEGAKVGRRTDGWITAGTSADAETQLVVATLRDRARDLVRNNPYAARGLEVKVANTIGTGIVAEVKNKKLRPRWDVFVDSCDFYDRMDLNGVLAQVERCRGESGEALIRRVPTKMVAGGVPMKLQVLEPDHIDSGRDGRGAASTNEIRHGIERDEFGRVVAYWLFPEHPGEIASISLRGLTSERVPASDLIHVFRPLRAGQSRGVTDFAPVMLRARDLDDYDDAMMMLAKIASCLAVFITTAGGPDASRLGPVSTDPQGVIERLYPGLIKRLQPGESISVAEPKAAGPGYGEFQRFGLRAIAAGLGIPYELMTGDLSQVNYSSYRAGLVDFRRRIEQDQWLLYVPRVCNRIREWFLEELRPIAPGLGERTEFEWTPPRFELIDPLKETEAEVAAIQSGLDTWDEVVRRRGWTAEEQLDRIESWQKALKARGIALKSDYSNEIAAKASQSAPPPPEEDDDATKKEAA